MKNENKIDEGMKMFIEEICREYRNEFRKHRKDVTHLSQNGCFIEWENYKYIEGVKELWNGIYREYS